MSPFLDELQASPDTRVETSDDGRGHATFAVRDFAEGEVIFQEPALVLVYPSRDPAWLAAMRAELSGADSALAWQYCVAVHCLAAAEMPCPAPPGLQPFSDASVAKLADLCGAEDDADGAEPSDLATSTVAHLVGASESQSAARFQEWRAAATAALPPPAIGEAAGEHDRLLRWLAGHLDDVAVRVSRNGFQIADMSCRPPVAADGLFHRISFFNHCCAGMNNASWLWKGEQGLLTVKTTRAVKAGEELTISYIAKPWCDLGKAARRRYLKQNFNFVCLCKACCLPASAERPSEGREAGAGSKAKGNSKLASMLVRWMKDDHEDADEGRAAEASADRGSGAAAAPAPPGPKPELTDEQRLERVLQRCAGEGLDFSREDAAAALEAEGGHVGRTMIRLRRGKTAAASEDRSAKVPAVEPARPSCCSAGESGTSSVLGFSTLQVALAVGLGVAALALARWRLARRA